MLPKKINQYNKSTCYKKPRTTEKKMLPTIECTSVIPSELLPWLYATGSLTQSFEALAKQSLIVKPTFEGFKPLSHHMSKSLHCSKKQMAWVRNAHLIGSNNETWAYASSYFPCSTLKGKSARVRNLGSTPLGYVLFGRHKPTCERVITETYINNDLCFMRKNFYRWHGGTMLVQETFLPAFLKKINQS